MKNVNTRYGTLHEFQNSTNTDQRSRVQPDALINSKPQIDEKMNSFYLDLFKTKAHIGFKDWNKDMSTYLLGSRNNISIIDLKLTLINLRKTLKFLESLKTIEQDGLSVNSFSVQVLSGLNQIEGAAKLRSEAASIDYKVKKSTLPHVLFVNTSNKFSELIKQVGFETKQSFINERWVGGTLTNWKQSSESIFLYNKFGFLFDNFLKSSNIQIPIYQKLKKRYGGFDGYQSKILPKSTDMDAQHSCPRRSMSSTGIESRINTSIEYEYSRSTLPDVIVLINPEENAIAIHEAQLLKIPIIAFADSNTAITGVSQTGSHRSKNFSKRFPGINFIIPGNNKSLSFIYFCLNLISITLQKNIK